MAVILISIFLASLRAVGHKSQLFKDTAHLWVGGLIALWLEGSEFSGFYGWLALFLIAVELICFPIYSETIRRWLKSRWRMEVHRDLLRD